MIKIRFYSKDWELIAHTINHDYLKYRFLYLEIPDLKNDISELWFKYVGDENKFDEMIDILNAKGIIVSKEIESI